MSVTKRRSKLEKYDVHVRLKGKRHLVATVTSQQHAKAISDIALAMIKERENGVSCVDKIMTLRTLSVEAYSSIECLDDRFNINNAELHWSEQYEIDQHFVREYEGNEIERRVNEEVKKFVKIRSSPVPINRDSPYPDVPKDTIRITKLGDGVPSVSGVYFIWNNDTCEYVGQSINLSNRVRLSHQKVSITDRVSFLLFDTSELMFAESYYIGIMRPQRNFGSSRKES